MLSLQKKYDQLAVGSLVFDSVIKLFICKRMLDEKKMLIESMKKLIVHISNNKEHQNEIYRSLTKNDIVKIISNLEDSNTILRKMSARLLCELLYDNDQIKELFVQIMNIVPSYGNIILNKFPDSVINRPEGLLQILRYLKTARLPASSQKEICWFIDPDRQDFSLQIVTHNSFGIHEFLDPNRVLFGISFVKKDHSRNKITYPEFAINLHPNVTQQPEKRKIRTDNLNHSIGAVAGGFTDREPTNSHDFDKLIRSHRQQSSLNKGVTPVSDKPKVIDSSFTDRVYRPEDYSRYSYTNSSTIQTTISTNRRYAEETNSHDNTRVRTDQSDYLRNRPKQGLRLMSGGVTATTTGMMSPQNAQPFTSRVVDKILRDKGNNKDDKQVIVLGGNKQPINGTLTDREREPRESFEPTSKMATYLIKGNCIVNNFGGREYTNTYTPTSEIHRRMPEQRQSNQSSFQGGYKPSEVFLKKIKDSAKK